MQTKLGFFRSHTQQPRDFFVRVTFHVVEKEDEPLGRRELDHRAFQMNSFHVSANVGARGGFYGIQGETTNWHHLANLCTKWVVDVVGLGGIMPRECAQERVS